MEKLTEKLFVLENDLQGLWELSGRVKAILAWMEEDNPYIRNNVLAVMLGAPGRKGGSPEPQADASVQVDVLAWEEQLQREKTGEGTEAKPDPVEENTDAVVQERNEGDGEN